MVNTGKSVIFAALHTIVVFHNTLAGSDAPGSESTETDHWRMLAPRFFAFQRYRVWSTCLGVQLKPSRSWTDVVSDLAQEPNTLRMAALMKELNEVDPATFKQHHESA